MNIHYDQKLFPNGAWLLCAPNFFDVAYEINPWMDVSVKPSDAKAQQHWCILHHTLLRLGAWVDYVEPVKDLPDIVFTANAGLVHGKKVIPSKFRHSERQGEEPHYRRWFESKGFEVHDLKTGSFEGEGDALFAGEKLFAGFGFRTDKEVYKEIGQIFNPDTIVYCNLIDDRFYHLDTCFCPLNKSQALYFPNAFSDESIKSMKEHIELIEVPEEEAERFACNSVVLGKQIIIPIGCPKTRQKLSEIGFESFEVDMSEFRKGGGAAKCLSLRVA